MLGIMYMYAIHAYEHPCKLGNGFQCIWGAGVLSGSVGVGEGGWLQGVCKV